MDKQPNIDQKNLSQMSLKSLNNRLIVLENMIPLIQELNKKISTIENIFFADIDFEILNEEKK